MVDVKADSEMGQSFNFKTNKMEVVKDEKNKENEKNPLGLTFERRTNLMNEAYEYLKVSKDHSMDGLLQKLADICDTKEEVAFVVGGVVQMLTSNDAIVRVKD